MHIAKGTKNTDQRREKRGERENALRASDVSYEKGRPYFGGQPTKFEETERGHGQNGVSKV